MKISIIIPAFNVEDKIEKCLRSIWNQNLAISDYEVIIVDDGSTDNTYNVVKELIIGWSNIVLMSQDNQKQGAARNKALSIAKGDYIWFVDSDDYVVENVLSMLSEYAYMHSLDMLCFSRYWVCDGRKEIKNIQLGSMEIGTVYKGTEFICQHNLYMGPCFCLYRRKFMDESNIRFLAGLFYEDNEFMLRAYYYANRVMYIDVPCYNVVFDGDSTTRTKSTIPIFDLLVIVENMLLFCESRKNIGCVSRGCYYYAAMTFNISLNKLKDQDSLVKRDFITSLLKIKNGLLKSMFRSGKLKFYLEGFILLISTKLLIKLIKYI